jgi:coenzyme PQQ precursor peptide PqqA
LKTSAVTNAKILIAENPCNGYTNQAVGVILKGTETMEWTAPKFEEVALNCEINSYASAAL